MSTTDKSTPQAASTAIMLRAGSVESLFEPQTGWLRYFRAENVELLRAIYVAVRDKNWKTVLPTMSNLVIERNDDSFRLSFDAHCMNDEVDFSWRAEIDGDASGTITYKITGRANKTFLKNRIGLCILHPLSECAGQRSELTHLNGRVCMAEFPRLVAPHQPFLNLRAIKHWPLPGREVCVEFAGEVFETEDQRNWGDGSYKTYSTHLARPFPAEIKSGTEINHSARVTYCTDARRAAGSPSRGRANVRLDQELPATGLILLNPCKLPSIGMCVASHSDPLSDRQIQLLRDLQLDHLRVDLNLSDAGYAKVLRRAADEARALNLKLHIALVLGDRADKQLQDVAAQCKKLQAHVAAWLVFHRDQPVTTVESLDCARAELKDVTPGAPIGGGSNEFFAELNRNRLVAPLLDFVAWPISPQAHSIDDGSMRESLESQAYMVRTACAVSGAQPIHVSPLTLKTRPAVGALESNSTANSTGLPMHVDIRQTSLFAAGWTLGSLAALTAGGASSVTLFETTGWLGVIGGPSSANFPPAHSVALDVPFPIYHVLAALADYRGALVEPIQSVKPLCIWGLRAAHDKTRRILLANITGASVAASLEDVIPASAEVIIRTLDADSMTQAAANVAHLTSGPSQTLSGRTVELGPHAVVVLDYQVAGADTSSSSAGSSGSQKAEPRT